MASLPFRLKVPGRDELTFAGASTTSFRFRGLLHPEDEGLFLEWTGTARVERFGFTGIADDTLPLPDESLLVPYDRLRDVTLQGGWLLPRLLLMSDDLEALRVIPSEEAGRVSLWLARRDRHLAARIVEQVRIHL